MSSGEMLANQQFSECKTMLILDHEQYNMVYEGNFEGNLADKMNWIVHILYNICIKLYFILNIKVKGIYIYIYIKHLINLNFV